jgi:phosphate butyryltransferase
MDRTSTEHTEAMIENRTFDEIAVGDSAALSRTLTADDIQLFAAVSGDVNPAHLDPAYAATDLFHHVIAHGMWSAGLISAVLGTRLPGPGTIYIAQELRFLHPVSIGDTITASVTVREKRAHGHVLLDCRCTNQAGVEVLTGSAEVKAPVEKIRRPRIEPPEIRLSRHTRFQELVAKAAAGTPPRTAIVYPCDALAIEAAVEAAAAGLITPVLIGPLDKIRAAAGAAKADLTSFELIAAADAPASAEAATALVRAAKAEILMKGSLHTDQLMHAVVNPMTGLGTARRISHVYMMDVPGHDRPLLITDAAVNIAPTLEEKRDIVQNAVDLAQAMGIERPRVAILSAVETVNPKLRSTLDAAALCKMADRGQITGADVDGPLAFDNAVSVEAAREKGIISNVAGRADILVVPDLEAGNMLAKQLTFLAGADAAGVVLGARVPIVLTSRADSARTRIASCAVAVLLTRGRMAGAAGAGSATA